MIKKILLLSSILIINNSATTYYVSAWGGGDTLQTLAEVEAIIPTLGVGDSILFNRGNTWTTRAGTYGLSINTCKGSPSDYIVFGDYGSGDKPKFDFSGTAYSIVITGGSVSLRPYYLKIQNLHITSSNPTSFPNSGIIIGGSSDTATSPRNIILDSLEIDNLRDGIRGAPQFNNITVSNSYIHDCTVVGIYLGGGYNSTLQNNTIYNIGGGADYIKGIYMSDATNGLIEGNNISNAGASGCILIANGYNITIRGNILHDNDYEILQMGDRNTGLLSLDSCVIEKNTFYNSVRMIEIHKTSTYAGNGTSRVYIRNNIFYNASYYGIYNSLTLDSLFVYNNTFVNCLDAVKLDGTITNSHIKNNIFYNTVYSAGDLLYAISESKLSGVTLDNNLYYSTTGYDTKVGSTTRTLAQFQSAYPTQEQNAISGNPDFSNPSANIYGLLEGSIAIDAGTDLTGIVDEDFAELSRPQNLIWDIGAYEYDSESDPPIILPSTNVGGSGWWVWGESTIAATPVLTVRISSIDFGANDSSDTDGTHQFYLVNLSDAIVTVSDFSGLASPYSDNYTEGTINPDDSVLVTITMDRNQSGAIYNDAISITSDGGNYEITVTGILYTYWTFGNTGTGSTAASSSEDIKYVGKATSGITGKLIKLTARVLLSDVGNTNIRGIVYTDNSGSPLTFLATSGEINITNTTGEWKDLTMTGANQISITATTVYWIGIHANDPGAISTSIRRDDNPNLSAYEIENYEDGSSSTFTPTLLNGAVSCYGTVRIPQ